MPDKARNRMVFPTVIPVKKDDRIPCQDAQKDATAKHTLTDATANKTLRAINARAAVARSLKAKRLVQL
jgi:hypothetical protein